MLIRVSGGEAGIEEYLEEGQKDGRDLTRDELDERVVLAGNLKVMGMVIADMQTTGERYLHITLAFKEEEVPRDVLLAITNEFRDFAMSAFRPEEYCFYAEAHLPRVKAYADKRSGEAVERKPHIHVVIPKVNLLSGTLIDPLYRPTVDRSGGRLVVPDAQWRWLAAFQDHINAKYGLANPKDHQRSDWTDESTIISRYKGDLFRGERGMLKQGLLDALMERDVTSFEALRDLAAERGEVRVRRGRAGEYLNVKPAGAAKGINLKEFVFSPEFLALPSDQKRWRLASDARKQYVEAGGGRPSPAEVATTLEDWHALRARELKYINSGSRRRYEEYRAAPRDQRLEILRGLQADFYERHPEGDHERRSGHGEPRRGRQHNRGRSADRQPHAREHRQDPPPHARNGLRSLSEIDVVRDADGGSVLLQDDVRDHVEHEGASADHPVRRRVQRRVEATDSVLGQLVRDARSREAQANAAELEEFARIKSELDGTRLLELLQRSHGVTPAKYRVERAEDGSARIRAGTRRLNVSDYLTKELHLPWSEAAAILRAAYAGQGAQEPDLRRRATARRTLLTTFRSSWLMQRRGEREREWQIQRAAEVARRTEFRQRLRADSRRVRASRSMSSDAKAAALRSLHAYRSTQGLALATEIDTERRAFKARWGNQWHTFLAQRADAGDVDALAELRRLQPNEPVLQAARVIEDGVAAGPGGDAWRTASLLRDLSYRVAVNGVVTYVDDRERVVLRDSGRRVAVEQDERAAIEAGLRLAVAKFGPQVTVNGTQAFRDAAVEVAAQMHASLGLEVGFTDAAMNQQLKALREQLLAGAEFARAEGRARPPQPPAPAAPSAAQDGRPAALPRPPGARSEDEGRGR